jgi:hypothetical protein
MPLTENEKSDLSSYAMLLGDMGEPEAFIAAMRRGCERKANDRAIAPEEAKRWRLAAAALLEAEATVNAAQSPEARKLARHMEQWPAQDQGAPNAAPEANQTP